MVSAVLNVVVEMDSRLAALSRQDGADEDCVFGCLQAVLEDVPSPRGGQGYAEVLRDAGFCCVAPLKLLLVEDLVALGVPLGHARLIVSVVRPSPAGILAPAPEPVPRTPSVAAVAVGSRKCAHEFPRLGANRRVPGAARSGPTDRASNG